jgi:3-hydroxyisobutyrate dehydrogenase-like beta-hydroxyacid dehydrogenase
MEYMAMEKKTPHVGFVGLGIMGMPMARHIQSAGYPVRVFNRTASRMGAAEAFGAVPSRSVAQLAESSDVLITILTGPEAVRAVMEGPDGALAHARPGQIWIQMSTLDISSTRAFARAAQEHGVDFVDCPVTGSKVQAEAAELILLAGANPATLKSVRPLLLTLGKTIIEAGTPGAGTALKLCMNLIVAQMTTALAEAVTLAEASGVDPAHIFNALKASPALNCGYFSIKAPGLLKKEFPAAFTLDNMAKDVGFMLKEAAALGAQIPVTEAVKALLAKAQGQGLGGQDLSSVALALSNPKTGG